MLYLAADKKLPLIPVRKEELVINSEKYMSHTIYIEKLDKRYKKSKLVLKHLNKRFIYQAYTYQGCGCKFGFSLVDKSIAEEIEVETAGKRCIELLFNYIIKNTSNGEEIEIYSCWNGNEKDEKKSELDRVIYLSSFNISNHFDFKENQYTLIINS